MTLEEQQSEFLKNTYDYILREGDQWVTFGDRLVIANPEYPPFFVDYGGKITYVTFENQAKGER